MIDGLAKLASAFGYSAELEFRVGPHTTSPAVDVAWFAAGDHRVPLMIFEVESSASASMANNAMKVFSQDVDDFVKPLFFFHVLLAGGPDNDRIAALKKTWGTYNYHVYRLNETGESERLAHDILSQHRRLYSELDIRRLFSGLKHQLWSNVDASRIYHTAENLAFISNYLNDLAHLCLEVPALRPTLLDQLRGHYVSGAPVRGSYPEYIGRHFAGLLEIPLLVAQGLLTDDEALQFLRQWQTPRNYGLKRIGPHFGLNRDYDAFIGCVASSLFAIASIISRGHPLTRAWLAQELAELLSNGEGVRFKSPYLIPAQTWLLHINAAALRELSSSTVFPKLEYDLSEIHREIRTSLSLHRLTYGQLLRPAGAADLLNDVADSVEHDTTENFSKEIDFPEWTDVSTGYFPRIDQDEWARDSFGTLPINDHFRLALLPLIDESWLSWPTDYIVRAIHRK